MIFAPHRSWPLPPFTEFGDITQTHYTGQGSTGRVIRRFDLYLATHNSQTLRPLPGNTQSQQTDVHAFGGIRKCNPSKRTYAASRIRLSGHNDHRSVIFSVYLAILSIQYLLEQHNKTQGSKNKLTIFIIRKRYTTKYLMFHCVL
jgi:hypothetical protein